MKIGTRSLKTGLEASKRHLGVPSKPKIGAKSYTTKRKIRNEWSDMLKAKKRQLGSKLLRGRFKSLGTLVN